MSQGESAGQASLSDYLAVERTSLAWIRTGLALMGFGFVVARFGIFLEGFQLTQSRPVTDPHRFSLWSGTALILVGVLVNAYSAWRHHHLFVVLNRGDSAGPHTSRQGVVIALFLAAVGVAMSGYLISVRVTGAGLLR